VPDRVLSLDTMQTDTKQVGQ